MRGDVGVFAVGDEGERESAEHQVVGFGLVVAVGPGALLAVVLHEERYLSVGHQAEVGIGRTSVRHLIATLPSVGQSSARSIVGRRTDLLVIETDALAAVVVRLVAHILRVEGQRNYGYMGGLAVALSDGGHQFQGVVAGTSHAGDARDGLRPIAFALRDVGIGEDVETLLAQCDIACSGIVAHHQHNAAVGHFLHLAFFIDGIGGKLVVGTEYMPGFAKVVAVDDACAVAARLGADGVGCIDAVVAQRALYLSAHAEAARRDEDGCGIATVETIDVGGDLLAVVPCLSVVVTTETSHADRLLGCRVPHGRAATGTEQEHFGRLTVGHDRGIAHRPSPVGRVVGIASGHELFVAPGCSTIGRTAVVQLYLTQIVASANADVAQLVAIVAYSHE